ncbi:serine hydrolase [Streptomyces hundungensis]|uniref:serine hydrolase n=1 Tax=Streptomyces hundungensis TaxID=1077946 RepID=UPI0031E6202B
MVRTVSNDATRRLEEASVAGESPDKSEQQQSSGETTTSERDPGIAGSHSPSPSGSPSGTGKDAARAVNGSGADSGTGSGSVAGSVDQATAVFRAPRQEDGDSRLRAAVAAWVDQEADDAVGEAEGAAKPVRAAGDQSVEPGKGKGEADASPAEPASEGDAADTSAKSEESSSAAETEAAENKAAAPKAAATKAAESKGTEGAEPDAAVAAAKPSPAEPEASAEPEVAAKAEDAEAGKPEVDKPETDKVPAAKASAAKASEAREAAGAREASEVRKAAGAREASEVRKAAGAREASEVRKAAEAREASEVRKESEAREAAEAREASETREAAETREASSGARKASEAPKGDETREAAEGRKSGEAGAVEGADKPKAGDGVDHPTAVFKAPKPPAVDQPTAMLKLPTPQREPEAERTGEPAPERAAERTSQFVPLRSDDAGTGTKKPAAPIRRPEAPKVTPPPSVGFGAASAPGTTGPVPDRAERTRQQPLPPKPPLDLLAELTNTPPPAQTAVRSTVRRFKIWTPLVLLLLVVLAVVQIMRPLPDPKLTLTSSATFSFDGGTLDLPWPAEGQSAVAVDGVGTIGTHGEQKPAPLASVAKTMTAYVILKGHPISGKQEGDKITVDQQAEDDAKKPDESTAPIRKNQQFTEKQMLELLMIPSGNNAARLLARWDAGSEEAFIAKMNDAAKSLGMTNTTYTDPSGLKETTVSTPTDQLKLAQAVMQNDVFRGIVNTPQIKIQGIDSMIYNNNTILLKPGVSGIKTGSSTPAGGNLLWAADTIVDGKNQRIYGVVMGQRTGTTLDAKLKAAINNSYTLIKSVQNAVTSATVVKKGDVVGYVDDGLGGKTPLVAAKDLKAVGWPGLKVDVTLGSGGKPVPHSAKAGDVVGELSIGSGNGKLTAPVQLKTALAEPGVGDKLTRLG